MTCTELNRFIEFVKSDNLKHSFSECANCREKMLPLGRSLEVPKNLNNIKRSAVALICNCINDKLHLIFIRRSVDYGPHSGQIAFPGGKIDFQAGDKNSLDASIRETSEEIGLKIKPENLIFSLNQLFIPPSNFVVEPFVFFVEKISEYNLNLTEVDEVYNVPISELISENSLQNADFETIFGNITAPCYIWKDIKIWGATAMILTEFLCLYEKSNN